jgi:subfamily B ATP-binding cassette protein MsbA
MIDSQDRKILARLGAYLRPHLTLFIGAALAMFLVAGAETMIPMLMKPLLDDGFSGKLNDKLWQAPLVLIGLAMMRSLSQLFANYLLSIVISSILVSLRKQMFWRLLHAKAEFFMQKSASALINVLVFEVNNVLSILGSLFINFVRDFLTVVGLIAYLIYLNWRLTLLVVIIFPIIALFMKKINARLKKIIATQQSLTNDLAYIVQESATGHKLVKLHAGEAYEMRRFLDRAQALNQFELKSAVTGGLSQPLTQLIASIALSVVLVMALMQSSTQGVTVGGFAAFITAMMMVISPIKSVVGIGQPLQRGIAAAKMIFEMLDQSTEEPSDHFDLKKIASSARANGRIDFRDVSFAYPTSQDHRSALKNISLEILPGEVVAFVGPSGAGKSTLVNLLPRFFNPSSGQILLDEKDLLDWPLQELRNQIAFVGQDVVLFDGTIATNIAYGQDLKNMDRVRIMQALDAANLTSVIKALPQGIDTVVGMNANQFSGGQRQRLAIARAFYKNAPILILDEATSALDSESEQQIQRAMSELMKGKTTLIVAHRLSTIEQADRIVVLDGGKVIEIGTHQQLLKNQGLYAGLYRLQFS